MDTFYLQELAKKKLAEKEKYIHYLESQAMLNFGENILNQYVFRKQESTVSAKDDEDPLGQLQVKSIQK